MKIISKKIEALGGIISTKDITNEAESKRVRRAAKRGELIKLRNGLYAFPDAILDNMLDLERIIPGGVVCLYNAWSFYHLTTTVPPAFCVAINQKRKVVIPNLLPITLYYWKAENLSFGITEQIISGHKVHITDMERSVCDAVKYRNKIGLDVCAEIIRTYLRKKERDLSLLTVYAEKLRIWTTLKNYIEFTLE